MRPSFRIDSAGLSDVGKVRSINEDSFLSRPEAGLWLVADGMGGHDAGDFASQTVVRELSRIAPASSAPELLAALEDSVIEANAILRHEARMRGNGTMIGCTLALLVVFEGAFACVWSGDSRIYLVRHGIISQVTRDHTEAQELIDRGTLTPDEASSWPRRNVITRAIGVSDELELDMVQGRIEDGDVFVICSDGLTAHVRDDEIGRMAAIRPLERAVEQLIATTLDRGAKDNVTVVTVACREVTAVQPGAALEIRGES
jgi:serine/threonine protein phosphatase PrpC